MNIEKMMSSNQLRTLQRLLTPRLNKYIPHDPTPKQTAFLLLENKEAFYGGAAGGGKSDALLMAALQYVDEPNYIAILFRKTYSDLTLPGALLDRARDWLAPFINSKEVHWNDREKTYTFPSGATLTFGYLEHSNDRLRYQGAEFQFVGFDEGTQFREADYTYLFSRLRRLQGSKVPLRMRSASNPGGVGHDWVKRRFLIEGLSKGRVFIPATLEDNPYLDRVEYMESLKELDPITRAQLMEGNWDVRHGGMMFERSWFDIVRLDQLPRYMRTVRYWDLAATDPKQNKSRNGDPDWTVGVKLGEAQGHFTILDIRRVRKRPHEVERLVKLTAKLDGYGTPIYMSQDPGQAGISQIDNYAKHVLKGYAFRGIKETGSKVIRANPWSAAAERGDIDVLEGAWNKDFFDEIELFPEGAHDDQVDGVSGAYGVLRVSKYIGAIPIGVGSKESYWGG